MRNIRPPLLAFVLTLAVLAPASAENLSIGTMGEYTATKDDTLVKIARENNLGFVELRAANPSVDPWLPGAGTELVIPKWNLIPEGPRNGVIINLPEMRVYVFLKDKEHPMTFPIAIGREGLETPLGTTTIVRKQKDPIWRPTPRMRAEDPKLPAQVGPGPENPMGTHALYLGWAGYAMHGTNKPYAIGRRASSGCIRMYPEDIIKMFDMIPVGTKITTVDEPIKLAWIDNVLYLEAHPDIDQAIQMEETGQVTLAKLTDKDLQLVMKAAGPYKDRLQWAAIRNAIRERTGYPIMIARAPRVEVSATGAESDLEAKPVIKAQ
jgi:L,D-transpeptidase ErfK/SrfK